MDDYSYIGSGRAYLKELGVAGGHIEIGNCSVVDLDVSEDEKKLKNFMTPGGGTRNSVKRVDAVVANVTWHDVNADNLARFGYGKKTVIAAAAVTDEAHTAYGDAFVPFAFLNNSAIAPTVTVAPDAVTRANSTAYAAGVIIKPAAPNGFIYKVTAAGTSAGAPPTFGTTIGGTTVDGTATLTNIGKDAFVANTDYEVRPGGMFILPAGASADGGLPFEVSYTKAAASRVDMIVASGKEYELIFVGLNEARSGKATKLTAHRVKPGFLAALSLVGEDYAAPTVAIEVLEDPTKVGDGISKYMMIEQEA